MGRIAIIAHHTDCFWERPYVLHTLIEAWRSWGIEVLLADSPRRTVDADLAILHVDETFVPAEYLSLAATYPVCINRHTPDISKRFISRQLVSPDDGYEGPVIVKSNFNSGGWIEANVRKRRGFDAARVLPLDDYRLYDCVGQVPDEVWSERSFVVEKFLPEIVDGLYGQRTWFFLGSADYVSVKFSSEPIVKGRNALKRGRLYDVPQELREMREEFGFDYGKFDFGIVDGKAVLYDANRTPGFLASNWQQGIDRCAALAPAIREYVSV